MKNQKPKYSSRVALLILAALPVQAFAQNGGYSLPAELAAQPALYWEAHGATVKICTRSACGTGVLISNDGYVLTAKHIFGEPSEVLHEVEIPSILGFQKDATVSNTDHFFPPKSDFAILKLDLKADSKLAGHPLMCLPRAQSEAVPGARLWALGFPAFDDEGNGLTCELQGYSDGMRNFTTMGHIQYLTAPQSVRDPLDPAVLQILDGQEAGQYYAASYPSTHGMSGGPVVNEDGDLLGITTNGEGTNEFLYRADAAYNTVESIAGADVARKYFACNRVAAEARPESGTRVMDEPVASRGTLSPETLSAFTRASQAAPGWMSEFFAALERDGFAGARATWKSLAADFDHSLATAFTQETAYNEQVQFVFEEDLYPGLAPVPKTGTVEKSVKEAILGAMVKLINTNTIQLDAAQKLKFLERLDRFVSGKIATIAH